MGHSRIADGLALVILAPQRGGGGVAVVALSCRRGVREKSSGILGVLTRTDNFLRFLPRDGLGPALAVVVAHALGTGTLML